MSSWWYSLNALCESRLMSAKVPVDIRSFRRFMLNSIQSAPWAESRGKVSELDEKENIRSTGLRMFLFLT